MSEQIIQAGEPMLSHYPLKENFEKVMWEREREVESDAIRETVCFTYVQERQTL
jgi:hypothetical protein